MSEMLIRSVFYHGKKIVKTNRSVWANNAVPNAVKHMQINRYDATHCEVFDVGNGELHAVLALSVTGALTIVFKREIREGM